MHKDAKIRTFIQEAGSPRGWEGLGLRVWGVWGLGLAGGEFKILGLGFGI